MKNNCKECYEENKTPNIDDCNCCKMSKKYVITNCPAYRTECEEIFNFLDSEKIFNACLKSAGISCKDITDCPLKRIVERCNLYELNYPVNHAIQMLTQNIKDMLEIEEE